jgi:hypothetical protein
MKLVMFSNWAIGFLNGRTKEGLPNDIKYGALGVTTFAGMLTALSHFDALQISKMPIGSKLGGLFIGIPIVVGTQFCIGHYLGKATMYNTKKD